MALPLWNSKTAHATLLCLHPNDGVSLGICGSGYSSNINSFLSFFFFGPLVVLDITVEVSSITFGDVGILGLC